MELHPLSAEIDYRRKLASGEVDLVIGNWLQPPEELHLGRLMSDEIVCLVAPDHPAARGGRGWTVERYLQSEHVAPMAFHAGAPGVIDEHLAAQGLQRNIVVRSAHFSLIPLMVARSWLVLTTGRLFCSRYVDALDLRIVRCPVQFPPLTYYQLWHERTHAAPPLRWLRERVRDVARGSWPPARRRLRDHAPASRCAATCWTSSATPARAERDSTAVRYRPGHWLLIEGSTIVGAQAAAPDVTWRRIDHAGKLVLPGFIDTHVHSAQLDVIGSWGAQLLDWLETYTFPAEHRMVDPALAQQGSKLFLDALLAHGSTSAVVFPTVHKASVDALFDGALERGMRLIAGKVLMDRHAPKTLCDDIDDVDGAERDCHELIERWHGRGRLAYAVTPRFAPTSSDAQLAMAGRLLASRDGPVHADPRGREPATRCAGWPSCSPRRAATSTSTSATAC